jgi:uncharacterized membrane protein YadS
MFLSFLSLWFGAQENLSGVGLSHEVFGLAFGMLIGNVAPLLKPDLKLLRAPGKDGETYIKVGLVLLGVDLAKIAKIGLPGLIVSWLVTPVCLGVMWCVGSRCIKIKNLSFLAMLTGGTCVCGSSAATAVRSVVGGSEEDLTLAISTITLFTMGYLVALPYLFNAIGVMASVGAAALGGSINSTGCVIAASGIFGKLVCPTSDPICLADVNEVASVVKIIQNVLIGPIAVVLTLFWDRLSDQQVENDSPATVDVTSIGSEKVGSTPDILPSDEPEERVLWGVSMLGQCSTSGQAPWQRTNPTLAYGKPTRGHPPSSCPEEALSPDPTIWRRRQFHCSPLVPIPRSPTKIARGALRLRPRRRALRLKSLPRRRALHLRRRRRARCLEPNLLRTRHSYGTSFPNLWWAFLVLSVILTILALELGPSDPWVLQLKVMLAAISRIFFTMGFVGIGLSTDIGRLLKALRGHGAGSVVGVYLVGQCFNVALTLAATQFAFAVI